MCPSKQLCDVVIILYEMSHILHTYSNKKGVWEKKEKKEKNKKLSVCECDTDLANSKIALTFEFGL